MFCNIVSNHLGGQEDVASNEQFFDFKWKEIQRLGLAGFCTEISDSCREDCLDLADEISKAFKGLQNVKTVSLFYYLNSVQPVFPASSSVVSPRSQQIVVMGRDSHLICSYL